jgi:hypothetical protein
MIVKSNNPIRHINGLVVGLLNTMLKKKHIVN